jgi:hypothetical protein
VVSHAKVITSDGQAVTVHGAAIPAPFAKAARDGQIKSIDIFFAKKA